MSTISPTASIDPAAKLGHNVKVGHNTVVYGDVEIGDDTTIGEFCVIGEPVPSATTPLRVGAGSTIRSHSVLYQGSEIGSRLETGHFVLIRAGARIGENLRIGSYSSLEGDMRIGDFVRMQGNVQIGPGTVIEDCAWIFSLVTATNDPLPPSHVFSPVRIGAGAVVCVGATLMPGSTVGTGAFVAAGAQAKGDIPAGVFVDVTGEVKGPITHLIDLGSGTRHPWTRHFGDALPQDAAERVHELQEEMLAAAKQWRTAKTASA